MEETRLPEKYRERIMGWHTELWDAISEDKYRQWVLGAVLPELANSVFAAQACDVDNLIDALARFHRASTHMMGVLSIKDQPYVQGIMERAEKATKEAIMASLIDKCECKIPKRSK